MIFIQNKKIICSFFLFLSICATAARGSIFHVRIVEKGQEDFNIDCPVALLSTLISLFDNKMDLIYKKYLEIGEKEIVVNQLRDIWNTLKQNGQYQISNINPEQENIRFLLSDGYLIVETNPEFKNKIHVKIPIPVLDIALSGTGPKLNLNGALSELNSAGELDLVQIKTKNTHVKIWID